MKRTLELLVAREDANTFLLAPTVGVFTCSLPPGRVVVPGEPVGTLATLGVSRTLVVPPNVSGRITGERPERVHHPVAYRQRLYELEPLRADEAVVAAEAAEAAVSDLVLASPHTGRFWHRPSPSDPAFANVGDVLEEGATVGLIEVMKTFTHVHYRATGGLPPRAKLLRFLVDDGAEATEGAALIEVEPA